jgi:hypothetical protein
MNKYVYIFIYLALVHAFLMENLDSLVLDLRDVLQEKMYSLNRVITVLRYDVHVYIVQLTRTTSSWKFYSINCSYDFRSKRHYVCN